MSSSRERHRIGRGTPHLRSRWTECAAYGDRGGKSLSCYTHFIRYFKSRHNDATCRVGNKNDCSDLQSSVNDISHMMLQQSVRTWLHPENLWQLPNDVFSFFSGSSAHVLNTKIQTSHQYLCPVQHLKHNELSKQKTADGCSQIQRCQTQLFGLLPFCRKTQSATD